MSDKALEKAARALYEDFSDPTGVVPWEAVARRAVTAYLEALELQLYGPYCDFGTPCMDKDPYGEWVRYEDVAVPPER